VIELGGNIELVGFREVDPAKMVVVKKMVGNYARKMSDLSTNFEKLTVSLKTVGTNKFEVNGKLMDNGRPFNAQSVDFNLFFALDKSLGKIVVSINK